MRTEFLYYTWITSESRPIKKRNNTKDGQFQIYVAYLEQHDLLRSTITVGRAVSDPDTFAKLWDTLTDELNAYGVHGPRRSTEEWQKVFASWKHNIRSEARKLRRRNLETGTSVQLSDLKQRALNLLSHEVADERESDVYDLVAQQRTAESDVYVPLAQLITDERPYLEADKDVVCRGCMKQRSPSDPDRDRRSIFDADNPILHLYMLFTSIEVSVCKLITPHCRQHGLILYNFFAFATQLKPTSSHAHFCDRCEQKLLDFNEFRNMCVDSDRAIRLQLNDPLAASVVPPLSSSTTADHDATMPSNDADHLDKSWEQLLLCKDEPHPTSGSVAAVMDVDEPHASELPTADLAGEEPSSEVAEIDLEPAAMDIGPLQCDHCRMRFDHKDRLLAHLLNQHVETVDDEQPDAVMDVRPANRRRKIHSSNLLDHMLISEDVDLDARFHVQCDLCYQQFDRNEQLHDHQLCTRRHDDDVNDADDRLASSTYRCDLCPTAYGSWCALIRHTCAGRVALPGQLFNCPHCTLGFLNETQGLRAHMRRRHPSSQLTASWGIVFCDRPNCGKFYATAAGLRNHCASVHDAPAARDGGGDPTPKPTRTRKPTHICEQCGEAFNGLYELRGHVERRHSGMRERNFPCPLCDARSHSKELLWKHLSTHKTELVEQCAECPRRFTTLCK